MVADFGPKITIKIVESLREDIYAGKIKSGSEIKVSMLRYSIFFSNTLVYAICCFRNKTISFNLFTGKTNDGSCSTHSSFTHLFYCLFVNFLFFLRMDVLIL